MNTNISYITNQQGQKISVVIPYQEWINYEKILQKQNIIQDIKESMKEIKEAKKTGKSLQSLEDFLNEIE